MPEPDFDKDIELAKLQFKISEGQTGTYAFVSVAFAVAIGVYILVFSPSSIFASVGGGIFVVFLVVCVIAICVLAGWTIGSWWKFQSVIRSDFDKIYRKEKISLSPAKKKRRVKK